MLGERQPGDMAVDSAAELHIEQGPILDKEQIDIGVVTGVQGISWQEFNAYRITASSQCP